MERKINRERFMRRTKITRKRERKINRCMKRKKTDRKSDRKRYPKVKRMVGANKKHKLTRKTSL